LEQLKMLEKIQEKTPKNPHGYGENETYSQVAKKLRTHETVAKEYGLSKDTVARYLRIHALAPRLKTMLDDGKIAFLPAVTLSYLKAEEQALLADCMERDGLSVDMKKSDMLRQHSEKGKLDGESVRKILAGDAAPKPSRAPAVRISKTVYARYFGPGRPAKEVQATVEKALEMYFGSGGGAEK
jgi:ParB family chromosome partitioning protein